MWLFFIISIPQFSILKIIDINNDFDTIYYGVFLPIRFFRIIEIYRFIEKIQEFIFHRYIKGLLIFKFFINGCIITLFAHASAALWLSLNKYVTSGDHFESTNPDNPFGSGILSNCHLLIFVGHSYFVRTDSTEASLIQRYVDSLLWGVSAMAGCSFGDVTPRTFYEIIASLVVMVLGTSVLAVIFGDFTAIMKLLETERSQEK